MNCSDGNGKAWLAAAAVSGFFAVAFGAAVSHLSGDLPPQQAGWIEIGLRYQMLHTAALLAVGVLGLTGRAGGRARLLDAAGLAFVAGLLVFSGLLYVRGLGGPAWLSSAVPFGGLSYMAGWLLLLAFALTRRRSG